MSAAAGADLDLLLAAAAEAGRVAQRFFRQSPQVWWKEGHSPVSEADFAVDTYLRQTLLAARPDYGWLSEETEAVPITGPEPDCFFVVDPIDGTRAFLRGEETWCVALAVIRRGRPVAAVVDAPAKAEVFHATRDGGAFLNGAALDLSESPGERPFAVAMPDGMRKALTPDMRRDLRATPSAPSLAYRIAQVAAARIDGTLIRPSASDWDIAAADLILAEAGGRLGDIEGEERLYKLEGRRHGLLIAGARHAWPTLQAIARAATSI
ncbi:3'(2'),5'-bisphosphate nucleotidase CysQ [Aureimonas endophytica]|uniref:3'(2'),5'-bisphosphate nucleotidase CysQ n=1 Tax=Aureimonas endophytica TaxID=2027858 RepID=A0A916ZJN5_9HYPH|nr:3'(2'),5'-bisphosphate nucleotidase CysQ [Aureimonas endophytica]GGD99606.1 3'(2'),5'-bisphosphate nucleotidase CysQ [Aureimonas endophytica]